MSPSRKPPLFLLAAPRCFTSVSASILGAHPSAYSVPELNLLIVDCLQDFIEQQTDVYYMQQHGILRAIAELCAGEQTLDSIAMAQRWLFRRLRSSTGDIYREICEMIYPLTLVDKSPAYSVSLSRLNRIKANFPDAYYLHITRHPVNMNKSMHGLRSGYLMAALADSIDYSLPQEIVDPQFLWFNCNANIVEFFRDIPSSQRLAIKGEDILNDREKSLELICNWLDWDFSPSSYSSMLHPERSVYARFGPLGAELGNDPNFLASPSLKDARVSVAALSSDLDWIQPSRKLYPHVQSLARTLGYD